MAMTLDPAFVEACAPTVAVSTIQAIVERESAYNQFAVNINGGPKAAISRTLAEAKALVIAALAQGKTADLGLMQINSSHLGEDGLSVEAAFDPCTNLSVGGRILTANYLAATATYPAGQPALIAALSMYNTGNFKDGVLNGYVARYYVVPSHAHPASATFVHSAVYTANPGIVKRNTTDDN
jgi:type IV secretion system protein VirB1